MGSYMEHLTEADPEKRDRLMKGSSQGLFVELL